MDADDKLLNFAVAVAEWSLHETISTLNKIFAIYIDFNQ